MDLSYCPLSIPLVAICYKPMNTFYNLFFQKTTEGRVGAFNHEVVPNYLRTKLVPETEEREIQLTKEAAHISPEMAQVRPIFEFHSKCYVPGAELGVRLGPGTTPPPQEKK